MTLFRVYRDKEHTQAYYFGDNEVFVIAENANQAKGIALAKRPSLGDMISKKLIHVEEISMDEPRLLK